MKTPTRWVGTWRDGTFRDAMGKERRFRQMSLNIGVGIGSPDRQPAIEWVSDPRDSDYARALECDEVKERVWQALEQLRPRHRDFLLHYYFDGMTYTEIGKTYGLSRQRARQVIVEGLSRMKVRLEALDVGADVLSLFEEPEDVGMTRTPDEWDIQVA